MIKSIRLTNIMTHINTLYEFPQTGIVNICGENSNGKSVLTKAVDFTLCRKCLHIVNKRDVLIRHGCSCGEVEYSFYSTDVTLLVHIEREACNTYYQSSKDSVKVYITGQHKIIEQLVNDFGIAPINIYKHLQPLAFVTTSPTENYITLSECVRDIRVENAVENLEIQLKSLEDSFKQISTNILVRRSRLETLPNYDLLKEENFISIASSLFLILKAVSKCPYLTALDIPELVPKVDYVILKKPIVLRLSIPKELPKTLSISVVPKVTRLDVQWFKELETLHQSVCPTCGRSLLYD